MTPNKRILPFYPLITCLFLAAGLPATAIAASDQTTKAMSGDEVLVEWRDQKITARDFENEMERIPEKDRYEYRLDQARIYKSLDNMLVRRALAEEARSLGMDNDAKIKAELAFGREQILAKARVVAFQKSLPAVDFEKSAQEYYKTKPAEFQRPERIRASHVLIEMRTRTPEEAEKRAAEVHQKAVAGEDFAKLALEYSDEPAAKKSKGELGFFTRGKMVKQFEDAAFALSKAGEISPVIKTRFGYHIIRLEAREPERVAPYEEVRDSIVSKIKTKFDNDQLRIYLDGLRDDKSLVMHPEAIARLKTKLPDDMKKQLPQK